MRCHKCGKDKSVTEFYRNRKTCRQCVAVYVKAWSELNKDKRRSPRKLHYAENREYELAKCAEYRAYKKATDPDYANRYAREYRNRNRDKINARLAKWRARNRKRLSVIDRRYRLTHKEKISQYGRDYALKNRLKIRAHWAVKSAIKSGRMVRPEQCSRCGASVKPQAHHPDYSKKRTVIWLCPTCHSEVHSHVYLPAVSC